MFSKRNILLGLVTLLTILALAGCNLPQNQNAGPTTDPNALYTQAAMTVAAQLTQNAAGTQVVVPSATLPPSWPTHTVAAPTAVPPTPAPPTSTSLPPTATTVPIPCDRASFVQDVTFPDNTEVAAGTTFVKTWRLKNNGSCTWTSGYAFVFDNGDAMGAPASSTLTTGTVPPGGTIDISVTLKAPSTAGTYRAEFKLRNAAGATFGIGDLADKTFWVQIKVVVPNTPTVTPTSTPVVLVAYDFVARGPDAQWRNGSTTLPWGDPPDDAPGVAVDLSSVKLDDGKTYSKSLATYPQRITDGIIIGTYPSYTIQSGDHFRTILGLREDCGPGKVRYQLRYLEGANDVLLGDWLEIL